MSKGGRARRQVSPPPNLGQNGPLWTLADKLFVGRSLDSKQLYPADQIFYTVYIGSQRAR